MPFDFFNTSFLAFGLNITSVFQTLGKMLDDCSLKINILANTLTNAKKFSERNYRVAYPTSDAMAVQGSQLYGLLKKKPIIRNAFTFDEDAGTFSLELIIFNPANNKITHCSGTMPATIKRGYCYIAMNTTYTGLNTIKPIQFAELSTYNDYYERAANNILFLFKYYVEQDIDTDKYKLNISDVNNYFGMYPSNYDGHYNSFTITPITLDSELSYTATGYEMIIGTVHHGATISCVYNEATKTLQLEPWVGEMSQYYRPFVAYLYPGEKIISGNNTCKIYRISYGSERSVY